MTLAMPFCFGAQQTWPPRLKESTQEWGSLGRKQLEVVYASKPTPYRRGCQEPANLRQSSELLKRQSSGGKMVIFQGRRWPGDLEVGSVLPDPRSGCLCPTPTPFLLHQ